MTHTRETVTATGAPEAAGPYSHAVRAAGLLFLSGQTPVDPNTGQLVGETPGEQVARCLDNLAVVAAAAGASLEDAVRMTIYVTDMSAFPQINESYGSYFESDPPARTTIGVAALPLGAKVEVDAILALET
jgi:2-iminobutanoate/2-iminopropanoate deaminase